MRLSIRYDDLIHRKLKVIAAYEGISLNKLITKSFENTITEWESSHSVIEIPVNE